MEAVASKTAKCGGMLTHHAFQEMWKTLPTESSARKELCYRLEQGLIELVPARARAWGHARHLTRNVGNPVDNYSGSKEETGVVRWKQPRWLTANKPAADIADALPSEAPADEALEDEGEDDKDVTNTTTVDDGNYPGANLLSTHPASQGRVQVRFSVHSRVPRPAGDRDRQAVL
jgi:hypothetical protein